MNAVPLIHLTCTVYILIFLLAFGVVDIWKGRTRIFFYLSDWRVVIISIGTNETTNLCNVMICLTRSQDTGPYPK